MPKYVEFAISPPEFTFDISHEERVRGGIPTKAYRFNKRKMTEFIFGGEHGTFANQRVKDAIEDLEPGVHHFYPLEMFNKDGSPVEDQYYWFLSGQGVGAVLSWRSGFDGHWWKAHSGEPLHGLKSHSIETYYLSRSEVTGYHLWGNLFHGPHAIVFSDELWERLQPLDTKNMRVYSNVKVVDEVWNVRREIGVWLDWMDDNLEDMVKHYPPHLEAILRDQYEYYSAKAKAQAQ